MNKKNHVNNTEMDLSLYLKLGTWSKDKSPEMKALKKIIKTFPWMAKVAHNGFDREYADGAHIEAAVETLGANGIAEVLKGYKGVKDEIKKKNTKCF